MISEWGGGHAVKVAPEYAREYFSEEESSQSLTYRELLEVFRCLQAMVHVCEGSEVCGIPGGSAELSRVGPGVAQVEERGGYNHRASTVVAVRHVVGLWALDGMHFSEYMINWV